MKPKKLITVLIILAVLIAGAMVAWNRFGKPTGGDIIPTPTVEATVAPTESVEPTTEPTTEPTKEPTPMAEPTATNTPVPTEEPTPEPTAEPTEAPAPTAEPTPTEIPVHVHAWEKKEVKPTCTEGGRTWEECACGEIQNEVILNALGHGELVYAVVAQPTVETEGEYEESCSVCKEVVNRGNIVKLSPTPVPTSTPTPTPTNTPTPTPTNTPTPTPTSTPTPKPTSTPVPTPTSTPTPKPTSTPAPTATSTPIPSPTAKPVVGEIVIGGGETDITLTTMEPVEYVISLVGEPSADELEYALSRDNILDVRLEKGTTERQYTLRLQPYGINGKAGIELTLYGKDEYGHRAVCDEVMVNVKVEMKAYDPVADGYPYYVETWTYEGITMEKWAESENSLFSVLIITGEGAVKPGIYHKYTIKKPYDRVKKMVFGEGITEISDFLPVEYLQEVIFPSTLKSIGACEFQGADLTEVILPEGVEEIGRGAFMWCNQLEKVILPSTLKSIGSSAFSASTQSPNKYTNNLLEIFIPKSVEFINFYAFEYRYGLVITVEAGTDTSGYAEEWYHSGSSVPHTVIYE